MAGHSKWANIKHRKDRADKKKGKLFSRLAKEIISAVKQGGPDPKANSKLKLVIQKAKAANLPSDTIERNIKKASSASQEDFHEVSYEIYGHGGTGIIVDVLTDNKNRSASDIRIAINKCGGNIANPGAVAFNFDRKGVIQIPKEKGEEEAIFEVASDAGVEDFDLSEDQYIITTAPEDLYKVKEKIEEKGIDSLDAELTMIPKTYVECKPEDEEANIKLIEWLENIDDIDAVYHNMNL